MNRFIHFSIMQCKIKENKAAFMQTTGLMKVVRVTEEHLCKPYSITTQVVLNENYNALVNKFLYM